MEPPLTIASTISYGLPAAYGLFLADAKRRRTLHEHGSFDERTAMVDFMTNDQFLGHEVASVALD
jgi:hypothetical protein